MAKKLSNSLLFHLMGFLHSQIIYQYHLKVRNEKHSDIRHNTSSLLPKSWCVGMKVVAMKSSPGGETEGDVVFSSG